MSDTQNRISEFIDQIEGDARERYDALGQMPRLAFPRSSSLPTPPPGWHDMAYAITMDGKLAIMRASFDLLCAWDVILHRRKTRADLVIPADARATLSTFDGELEGPVVEIPFCYPFPHFDLMADGSWIVADNGADQDAPNAYHFAENGRALSQFKAGGGILNLQADPDGGFWIAYGDQGVFTGEHGFEHGGVVRFDHNASPIWLLNSASQPEDGGVGRRLSQCDSGDALNITSAGRWAYTFPDFLLTRFDAPAGPRSLRSMVEFADTLAVLGDRLMLIGMDRMPREGQGYDRLVRLGRPERWTPRRPRIEWVAAVEQPVATRPDLWAARGDTLHCVSDGNWSRLSIDEADALVPPGPWRFS